jgi:DNA ligase (NAD+)
MNIDGLSEATLEKFINKGWLVNFSDVYSLDAYAKEMQKMEGFGIKSINKLLANIAESKNVTMERFLCALSIPGIGRSQSKLLATKFNHDWVKFEKAVIDGYNFALIEGIGSVLNTNIHTWYANEFVENGINKLTTLVNFLKPKQNLDSDNSLQDMVFVITGSLNHFTNRDELKCKLEEKGAKVAGSISKKTNYLINNDSESSSSKNKKAKELGVAIITEEELINRYLK